MANKFRVLDSRIIGDFVMELLAVKHKFITIMFHKTNKIE